ncbi:MAG: hypothetical protein AB1898_16705 [Acidobacteriota bacterium]
MFSKLKFWKPTESVAAIHAKAKGRDTSPAEGVSRPTSALKDFIQCITRKENPCVLDIGPVVGSNIEFFMNYGIKIYMEDFLAAYAQPGYSVFEDGKLKTNEDEFFRDNFKYAPEFFDGLICWDILSFLDPRFAKVFVEKVSPKLKSNAFVLVFFHTQQKGLVPVYKYRVAGDSILDYVPLGSEKPIQKVYQTRDVNQLFVDFESQKFYLLKHQILEVVLKKK